VHVDCIHAHQSVDAETINSAILMESVKGMKTQKEVWKNIKSKGSAMSRNGVKLKKKNLVDGKKENELKMKCRE